jgi:hypothetical protein
LSNIDPLYFVTPAVVISFSAGLVLYWHFSRRFTKWTLLSSLVAYGGAIALKYAVQIPTFHAYSQAVGSAPAALGLYYGVQTALFEVGGAYLVASYAVSKRKLSAADASGYGIGLAFWENGVLLGLPLLVEYIALYAVLSVPGSAAAQAAYALLSKSSPGLFYGPAQALPLIGLSLLERASSLIAHLSWGVLAVLAAALGRRKYLAAAFPLGFIVDFLVPFAGVMGLGVFEFTLFAVSLAFLVVTLAIARGARKGAAAAAVETVPPAAGAPATDG